jgi:hypothetical protein
MADWQPISTAPRDGTAILGYGIEVLRGAFAEAWAIRVISLQSGRHRYVWRVLGSEMWLSPTHWMPLPAAPRERAHPMTEEWDGESAGEREREDFQIQLDAAMNSFLCGYFAVARAELAGAVLISARAERRRGEG